MSSSSSPLRQFMGSDDKNITKQAGSTSVAPPSEVAQASRPISDSQEQPAAVQSPKAQLASEVKPTLSSDASSDSCPRREPSFTRERGPQEAQLQPLQDADLVVDSSLPPPHPRAQSASSQGLPRTLAASEGQTEAAAPSIRSSPFASEHSADSAKSSAQFLPAPSGAGKGVQATPEVQANSSLQPATPPLQTPAGLTPASRPASEQEGEPPLSGALSQGSLQGIARGIQAAIERKLRCIPWTLHQYPSAALPNKTTWLPACALCFTLRQCPALTEAQGSECILCMQRGRVQKASA